MKATPAGLDVYVRNPDRFDREKAQKLMDECKKNKDETVAKCAEDFFHIPRE